MNYLRCRVISTISLIACSFILSLPIASEAGDILYADFENQTFGTLKTDLLCCSHSAVIQSNFARAGKYATKFTLNSTDKGYISGEWEDPVVRAELRQNGTAMVGSTRWYGMSIMVDPSWRDDTNDPNGGPRVASWHRVPDPGEYASKSGHLGIIVTKDLRWTVTNVSDPNYLTTKTPTSFTKRVWNVGPVEKGKWVDWVIYAKWSYKSDGILKVWKNGALVINYLGPNVYNDRNSEFFKFGIYKSWWDYQLPPTKNTLIVYYDEVRIGDQNSSYNAVAPKGSGTAMLSAPTNLEIVD
jgi:Polysaccharide lyase